MKSRRVRRGGQNYASRSHCWDCWILWIAKGTHHSALSSSSVRCFLLMAPPNSRYCLEYPPPRGCFLLAPVAVSVRWSELGWDATDRSTRLFARVGRSLVRVASSLARFAVVRNRWEIDLSGDPDSLTALHTKQVGFQHPDCTAARPDASSSQPRAVPPSPSLSGGALPR